MTIARHLLSLGLLLPIVLATSSSAEPCREIHGRAVLYTGDGQLAIWHIGTHHMFLILDDDSDRLLSKYMPIDALPEAGSKALFADFTICPTEKYVPGGAQPAIVKRIRNPHLTTWTVRR